MDTQKLFVYGTLKEPNVRSTILGRNSITFSRDSLLGFRMSRVVVAGVRYPAIVPDGNSASVHGLVLELTDAELRRVDRYEGRRYNRKTVRLASGEDAWVYVKA